MEIPQPHTLNFTGVLSTSKTIILTKYTHFVTLSLFFLPLSLSLIINPTLQSQTFTNNPSNHQKLLTSYLLYTLTIHFFALCAIGTITYSAHHAFFGEPVDISNALKSLIFSFFPLASTAIAAYVVTLFISIIYVMLVVAVLMLVHNVGFVVIDSNSIYFTWFSITVGVVLIAIVVYVHVKWSLAFVVVVVESKWGFAPLMRSAYLVKGMRSVSLLVMLYFGVFGGLIVWMCFVSVDSILITTLASFFLMMFLLRMTAANTVLYNYCKALHGELVIEVAEGFDYEYMNLPEDDEKVPHVVGVVAA
ncbi:hypothetical protein L1987_79382 [Smallanthus sonchifolius]|uniref:Uncharacterized protein n=1 Tax=Smallanthus sonchifolius TaxID=185202 RepID=A0ACB8ZFK0_9ASTR|nr:hypothetical protein L1987_79382 [Smallanthus sonchifolius]